ncbi:MAG: tetratricopeptide repeat protein [Planctomycetaceae bacterium]
MSAHAPCHPEDVLSLANALQTPGLQLVQPGPGDRWGSAARRSFVAAVLNSGSSPGPVLRIRGDSESARQSSQVSIVTSLEWPERVVRQADYPRTGCLRFLAEHPDTLLWIDDVADLSVIDDLLPWLTRYQTLLTVASPLVSVPEKSTTWTLRPIPMEIAESWAGEVGCEASWQSLTAEDRQRLASNSSLLQVWSGVSRSGANSNVSRLTVPVMDHLAAVWWDENSARPAGKLQALWCHGDWELFNRDWLLSARNDLQIDSDQAVDGLREMEDVGLAFRGCEDGLLVMDSEWHAALIRTMPAEHHERAVKTWDKLLRSAAASAEPRHVVVHACRLAGPPSPEQTPGLDGPDGVLSIAIDGCLAVGAWRTGAELATRLVRLVDTQSGARSPAAARAWRRLSLLQQAGNRLLAARKSARTAEDILEGNPPSDPQELGTVKCDIAELDLDEGRSERAFHRLEALRPLLQSSHVDRLLVARWMYLRAACLLAGKDLKRSERLLRRVWKIRRELLPEDHEDLLALRSLLARNLFAQRRWVESEAVLTEDLRVRRESPQVPPSETAVAANLLADLYFAQGRLTDAEPLLEEVLQVRRQTMCDDDRLLAEAALRLGSLKSSRGAYTSADRCFRLALHLTEQIFGDEHPRVAAILNELAKMLFTQSRHDQSRRLLERAISIQERSLRKGDLRITETRNNLAAIYVARGFYDHAAKLYADNLTTARQQRAGDHPTLATTLNNLGDVYRSQGRYREAEEMLLEALAMRERLHGKEHPVVAQSLSNLAYLRMLSGHAADARSDVERALNIRRLTLGPVHPHTGNSLTTLGRLAWRNGDYAEALEAFQQAAEINRQGLGDKSQQYGASLAALGRCELRMGQPAKAELHLLKSRMLLEDTVGSNHRLYADSLLGLAELSESEGRDNEAFPSLERALTIQRQTLGSDRFEITETLVALGHNLLRRGLAASAAPRFEEADRLVQQQTDPPASLVVDLRRGQAQMFLDLGQPNRADACMRLALTLLPANAPRPLRAKLRNLQATTALASHRYNEAEHLLSQMLADCETEFGLDARELVPILDQLAAALSLQNRAAEAEPFIRRSIGILERRHGRQHVETAARLDHLSALLQRLGRLQEASQLLHEVIEIHEVKGDHNSTPLADALQKQAELLHRLNRSGEALQVEGRVDSLRSRTSHVLEDIL